MPDLMTLPEYAKTMPPSTARALVECFADSSDIMKVLPFDGMTGAVYEYHREASLPTSMAFRGINEAGTSGNGTLEPFQESAFILDHDLDVDTAIVRRGGDAARARYERIGMAKAGRVWANTFMTGDNTTQPREFNGIKKRVTMQGVAAAANTRTIDNSGSSGGAALSLVKLDQAINMVNGATHIIVPRLSIPLWIAAARTSSLTGFVMQTWDGIGTPKMSYAGRQFLFGYEREIEGDLIDFNEVGIGGGSAVTASAYIVKFGVDGVHGIQLAAMSIKDAGLLEDQITMRTHISWDTGLVDKHPFCLARLTSWTNAAIVA
jgi:hypothetical protein